MYIRLKTTQNQTVLFVPRTSFYLIFNFKFKFFIGLSGYVKLVRYIEQNAKQAKAAFYDT